MRVLVVDQDSASNLAITRSLRELYTVDCVTNKGDCLDLLRANTYDVIVATERLEDGSGLELLGQISKKWSSVLRIFAADRQRLKLLRGRLGPFELFQTLAYPIDPEKLLATLEMATAAQQGDGQEIELSGEAPAEAPTEAPEAQDPFELEQSDEFEEPRFARAGRASSRGAPSAQTRPTAPAQRPRSVPAAAPAAETPRGTRARRSVEPNRANDLAARFPGSGTIGPRSPAPASAARSARPRSAASKAPPVRFPPLERTPPLERIPPLEPPTARNPGGEFSEAAAMARAARSNYEASSDEVDTKRIATLIGGGVAVAAVVVFLGFKMFGSSSEAPKPAPPVVAHAPEYPPEVTDLVGQIEAAFKADDFKTARADVDKLRQLSPSHPRLDFFEGLLSAKSSTPGRGAGKRNGKSSAGSAASHGAAGAGAVADSAVAASHGSGSSGAAAAGASQQADASSGASGASNTSADGLAPETPSGITRASVTPAPAALSPAAATAAPASGAAPAAAASGDTAVASAPATAAPAPAASAEPAHTPAQAAPAARRSGGEPPPVVQEAKLVRRVNPDYPSAAKKDGISGSVDLEVTVSSQGNVDNVSVVQSTPPDMFDKSAIAAVRKWKYDPRFVDGLPSQAHLKVHLEFGPNK